MRISDVKWDVEEKEKANEVKKRKKMSLHRPGQRRDIYKHNMM